MTIDSASSIVLPSDFQIGVATAAYQIEGGWDQDGRAPSIWDTYTHTPGRIDRGETGDVAVDHYNRLDEDLDLLADLGVDSYRFSVSWSRVIPDGRSVVNRAGLDFYERLVDGLLARKISPSLTMYHWDLPQALEDHGGWTSRDTAFAFAEYAQVLTSTLGDRVQSWMTLNEPWCAAFLGHASGVMAPGRTDPVAALKAMHHLNLAHGLAAQVARQTLTHDSRIGVAVNMQMPQGVGDTGDEAVRQIDENANQAFIGPMLRGAYPKGLIDRTGHLTDWGFVQDGDLSQIHQDLDFLGVNYYSTLRVRLWDGVSERENADGHRPGPSAWVGAEQVEFLPQGGPRTAMGWNIAPEALTAALLRVSAEFPRLPLYVTENGIACHEEFGASGTIDDPERVVYVARHLAAVDDACTAGADVRGYYLWTLIDNFEWSHGFAPRFGLVHVERPSLERVRKTSFAWYRSLAASKTFDREHTLSEATP